jgi:hypothetical protein
MAERRTKAMAYPCVEATSGLGIRHTSALQPPP